MKPINADEQRNAAGVSLYDRYAATIFAYLYQQVSRPQDVEDLLVEVFMAALNSEMFANLTDKDQLAWLRRVAKNKAIDLHRHTMVLTMLPLEQVTVAQAQDDALTPEQRAIQRERYEHLYRSLEQLSPSQQQLLQLRYGNGLRLVEIADMLHKPDGTVRKILARTLLQLRTILEQQEKGNK